MLKVIWRRLTKNLLLRTSLQVYRPFSTCFSKQWLPENCYSEPASEMGGIQPAQGGEGLVLRLVYTTGTLV